MGVKFRALIDLEPTPEPEPIHEPQEALKGFFMGPAVGPSKELDRVLAIPRRNLYVTDTSAAERWTETLRRPRNEPCDCVAKWGFCITKLNASQGWALEEASKYGGLLAPIGVGHGKTGVDILLLMAMGLQRGLLLIPANLRQQFLQRDYPQWSAHFKTPNIAGDGLFVPGRPVLHVVSYNELSQAKNTELLAQIAPDIVIADEAHNLKAKDRARTKRFLRLFSSRPNTKFAALSGTMTTRSIRDYAHLSTLALRENSPLPVHYPTLESWSTALDAIDLPAPPGALMRLCNPGEHVRQGFKRRLLETPGVVATEEASIGCSLILSERKVKSVPKVIVDGVKNIHESFQRPDGEELIDVMQKAAVARQMACGFYYRWQFRKGETPDQVEGWLDVRSVWHKELRDRLKHAGPGMDSPALLEAAARRWDDGYTHEGQDYPPHTKSGPLPVWASVYYQEWCAVRGTVDPYTVPVWVDDYLIEDAAEWAAKNVGIVWYQHSAVGERLAQLSKMPLYNAGEEANAGIILEKGDRSIIASIKAHGTGKNLQAFSKQLVVSPPSDAAAWEQLLGRTHRQGQMADEVNCEVYRHMPDLADSIDSAVLRARYVMETTGSKQRLLYANTTFPLDTMVVGGYK